MTAHCENCGTKIDRGFCPNCEESGFIAETQADYMPDVWSDEFSRAVEQDNEARNRRARATPSLTEAGETEKTRQ